MCSIERTWKTPSQPRMQRRSLSYALPSLLPWTIIAAVMILNSSLLLLLVIRSMTIVVAFLVLIRVRFLVSSRLAVGRLIQYPQAFDRLHVGSFDVGC